MIEESFASAQVINSSTVPGVNVMPVTCCSVPHDLASTLIYTVT